MIFLVASRVVFAGEFDQLDGPWLRRELAARSPSARTRLGFDEVTAMPSLLRDTRSALALAKTGKGNLCRLLLVPELHKPSGEGEPFPVLVVERLDTFDGSDPSSRLASKRDVVLFDGLAFDLDSGQVVPDGQGGDVVFRSAGEGGPRLETLGEARLFTLDKPPAFDASPIPRPTAGRAVVAADFAGRYQLVANGQWSGTLELKVGPRGAVLGQFRSDATGSSYPVSGQVATDRPQLVQFAIVLPRARLECEGYLWGEGKGAMAGTASLLERSYGFFALREGARYVPESRLDPLVLAPDPDRVGKRVIDLTDQGSKIRLDDKVLTLEELVATLKSVADDEPPVRVVIRASRETPFEGVSRVLRAVETAGVRSIRLEELGSAK
jgi:hypothetical protein